MVSAHVATLFLLALTQETPRPVLPPQMELRGFTGFGALEVESVGDLFGNAVLIDFFASWCAPCARQVPHLNGLQERYGPAGLVVLGVTGQERSVIEPWIEEHGVAFPYAFDPDLRLQIDLGFHPLPFAILLDPTGILVWSGKADQLDAATLERSLAGALGEPAARWPADAARVRSALAGHRYPAAMTSLEAVEDDGLRKGIQELIDRRLDRLERVATTALERGDLMTAHDVVMEVLPAAEEPLDPGRLDERFRALRERLQRADGGILEAQIELRDLWRTVHTVSTKVAADELLAELRGFSAAYPDTFVSSQAAGYEAALANVRLSLR